MWGEGREKGNRERAIIHSCKAFQMKKMDYIISLNWLMDRLRFFVFAELGKVEESRERIRFKTQFFVWYNQTDPINGRKIIQVIFNDFATQYIL